MSSSSTSSTLAWNLLRSCSSHSSVFFLLVTFLVGRSSSILSDGISLLSDNRITSFLKSRHRRASLRSRSKTARLRKRTSWRSKRRPCFHLLLIFDARTVDPNSKSRVPPEEINSTSLLRNRRCHRCLIPSTEIQFCGFQTTYTYSIVIAVSRIITKVLLQLGKTTNQTPVPEHQQSSNHSSSTADPSYGMSVLVS